ALGRYSIHGRLGDATNIAIGPGEGPTWDDLEHNFRVTIERGRYVPPGIFTSLEATNGQAPTSPEVIANATRVVIERPKMNFLAAPAQFRQAEYAVVATARAVKGNPRASCVAPFALHICSLMNAGVFSINQLGAADRLFTKSACEVGRCDTLLPE